MAAGGPSDIENQVEETNSDKHRVKNDCWPEKEKEKEIQIVHGRTALTHLAAWKYPSPLIPPSCALRRTASGHVALTAAENLLEAAVEGAVRLRFLAGGPQILAPQRRKGWLGGRVCWYLVEARALVSVLRGPPQNNIRNKY